MSVPAFKEMLLARTRTAMEEIAGMLVEQHHASLDQMRIYQGQIQGLKDAQEIINETYRKEG